VTISRRAGRIVDVRGDPEHPANFGRLCAKGATPHRAARPEGRIVHPEMRTGRPAARVLTGRDEALDTCADRFAEIIRVHGPDAVAFYVAGRLLIEDHDVFNKLAKGLIGTNNIDSNSRPCISSAVAGYKQTIGADAPPFSYEESEHADLLLIAGSNTAFAHPILYRRIEAARAARAARGLGVNGLTNPTVAPYFMPPEFKTTAIEVARAAQLVDLLRPMLERFDYATLTLAGRDDAVVLLRAYCSEPISSEVLDSIDRLLDLDQPSCVMRYVDAARRIEKSARIDAGRMTGLCLAGETQAAEWLKGLMLGGASLESVRPWILAPVSSPPEGTGGRGRTVCNCFDVALSEIERDAADGLSLAQVQAARRCGTSCGSCLPEVKRIIASRSREPAAA